MHETAADLDALQQLLDRSYAAAGSHLLTIVTPERRLTAGELSEKMTGVQILALATVTADARPLVGPVDGLFYRGEWWFGSAGNSVRFAHLRTRSAVSASHHRGEQLAVIVHGTADEVDLTHSDTEGFRGYCIETYGEEWSNWGADGAVYARIKATQMFAFGFDN